MAILCGHCSRAHATFSGFGRDVNLLLTATGILAISFFGIQMLLKILYVLRLGYGPAYLGMFNAAGALGYMAMSLPAGALGARLGLKRTMTLGVTVSMLGVAMLPFTEFVPLQAQPSWPILSQLILSGGYAMFSINLVPALMATTTNENRNSAYALSSTLRGLGTFVGTIFGGLLPGIFAVLIGQSVDTPGPYRLALWLGAAFGLVALFPLARIRSVESDEEVVEIDPVGKNAFPLLPMGLLIVYVCFSQAANATCQSFCSAYMDTELMLSPLAIGLITGAGQFFAIFAPLLGPRLAARHGNGWTMMMTTLGSALSLLPLILIATWYGAGLGRFGTLMLGAMWMPALQVYQMELVDRRWRSLAYAAVSMAMGLSFGVISYAGGYVAAGWGYDSLFTMGLILSAMGAAMMWGILKKPTLMVAAGKIS